MLVVAKRKLVFSHSLDIAAPLSLPPQEMRPAPARQLQSGTAAGRALRLAFAAATLLAIGYGWLLAARKEFIPDEGVGYWLGIAGGTALLVQLVYPLRKRARFMRRLGSATAWFRAHMILGIAGPLLILYHSNFSLGATNSNVALFAMLTVAFSGIAGRYIYGKIHNGLYGAHSNVHDLLTEATGMLKAVEADVGDAGGSIALKLTEFGTRVLRPRRSLAVNFAMALWLGFAVPVVRWGLVSSARKAINLNAGRLHWNSGEKRAHYKAARLHIGNYLDAVVKVSELSFYERLFAFWHVLHLPLFLLLIITGVVHVIAVHLY